MFAVIKTGGKQYKVASGDVILVEKLACDVGQSVEFDDVLMVGDDSGVAVGAPRVDGARVTATVLDQTRGEKIIVFKKKRRKNYRRRHGHRQDLTVLRITAITPSGAAKKAAREEVKTAEEAPAPAKPAPEKEAEAPAAKKAAKAAKTPAKAAKPAGKKAASKTEGAKTEGAKAKGAKTAAKAKPAGRQAAPKAKAAKKTAAKGRPSKTGKEKG